MKYQVLFSLKSNEKIFKIFINVVCCSRGLTVFFFCVCVCVCVFYDKQNL